MSIRKIQPITPHRSGWCLKLPASKWNQEEHDKCPKTFPQGDCLCPCDHKGERTLDSRAMTYQPYVPPKGVKIEKEVESTEEDI